MVKPLTLWIDKRLWDEFKETVPRNITLNDAVVLLIKEQLNIVRDSKITEEITNLTSVSDGE